MLGLLRAAMAESRVLSVTVPTATALADRVGKNAERNCRVTWRAASAFKSATLMAGWLRSAAWCASWRVSCGESSARAMANEKPSSTAQAKFCDVLVINCLGQAAGCGDAASIALKRLASDRK